MGQKLRIKNLNCDVQFQKNMPTPKEFGEDSLIIYDKDLVKYSLEFKKWIKQFKRTYPVKSGESLKEINQLSRHIHKISNLLFGVNLKKTSIVVVGGGTLGDFGGFIASVYKRGVRLVHIPSTWLAAIDSSHGGKTALNVGNVKNQIGTFYSAEKIFIVHELLKSQNKNREKEALAEAIKVALICDQGLLNDLNKLCKNNKINLWPALPRVIKAKYKIVSKDPLEKSGLRHVLNLGHTMGHALESYFGWPHGIAIGYGLKFALRFSYQKKFLSEKEAFKIVSSVAYRSLDQEKNIKLKVVNAKKLFNLLMQDKKKWSSSDEVRFVFIQKIGQVSIQNVKIRELIKEFERQNHG